MLRPTDLTHVAIQRVTTTLPVWTNESRHASTWFDPAETAPIGSSLSFDSRSLSVQEHTRRVLMHLTVERDVG